MTTEIEIASLVRQGKRPVCGQACVAMLTNKKLCEAVQANTGRRRRTQPEDLLKSLEKLDKELPSKLRSFEGQPIPDECWIVAVERHRRAVENFGEIKNGWHWILLANENGVWYVLDPAAGTKRGPDCPEIKRRVIEPITTEEIVTRDVAGGQEKYTPRKIESSVRIAVRIVKIAPNPSPYRGPQR